MGRGSENLNSEVHVISQFNKLIYHLLKGSNTQGKASSFTTWPLQITPSIRTVKNEAILLQKQQKQAHVHVIKYMPVLIYSNILH